MKIIAQLIPVPGGYAYQPSDSDLTGLKRGGPNFPTNPKAESGDVLSFQDDGSLQTRPHDQIGPWETMSIQGAFFVYTAGSKSVLILPPGL